MLVAWKEGYSFICAERLNYFSMKITNKQALSVSKIRFVLVFTILLILFSFVACAKQDTYYNTGDVISFGNYNGKDIEWIVLDVAEDSLLIISKECVVRKEFHELRQTITWEKCSSRKWLNETFYNDVFNADEKSRIRLTHLEAEDNTKYHIPGGCETDDYLFFLTANEAEIYFKDEVARRAINPDGSKSFWWLRTPGHIDQDYSYVTTDGDIIIYGEFCSNELGGIRPAMYISR